MRVIEKAMSLIRTRVTMHAVHGLSSFSGKIAAKY